MRISDWSSDVFSSDLGVNLHSDLFTVCFTFGTQRLHLLRHLAHHLHEHLGGPLLRATIVVVSFHRGSCSPGRPYRNIMVRGVFRRSEESRVGKECVSTCRYRLSTVH